MVTGALSIVSAAGFSRRKLDERLIEESEEYALGEVLYEKRYVCGWMSASLDPEEMATWIAELCKNQTGRNCASV
jgi:hypothetical protein